MIKKKQQRFFNAVFGFAFMIIGAVAEVYDLLMVLIFKQATDFYGVIVQFIIPLVLIYIGYNISRQKDFQLPNVLRS